MRQGHSFISATQDRQQKRKEPCEIRESYPLTCQIRQANGLEYEIFPRRGFLSLTSTSAFQVRLVRLRLSFDGHKLLH